MSTKAKQMLGVMAALGMAGALDGRAPSSWSEDHRISDPARVAKIMAQAQERRDRRAKVRTLKPRVKGITMRATPPKVQDYRKLPSGQIVGHPLPMRTVKQEARRTRLMRRTNHRIAKRFEAITKAALGI